MELEIGAIYEGKVTGITKFGAFVQLPGGKSGMVHISEIANTYVDDISKFLKDGQIVKVKLVGIDQANRINLSIKKALPQEGHILYVSRALDLTEPISRTAQSTEAITASAIRPCMTFTAGEWRYWLRPARMCC
jgi:predicted RNA-binding protein with RPS1 domain